MKVFRPAAAMAALLCLTALTSCAGDNDKKNEAPEDVARHHPAPLSTAAEFDTAGPNMACPQEAVLQQAQTVTTFLPGRTDVAAQITTAQITGISGTCDFTGHNKALLVTLNAGFAASNGPANNGATLTLPWFVAITQGDNIIQKQDYTIKLHFDGNASLTQAVSKAVKIELPNVPASGQTQILVGFEMTPEQQAYAAANPGATP